MKNIASILIFVYLFGCGNSGGKYNYSDFLLVKSPQERNEIVVVHIDKTTNNDSLLSIISDIERYGGPKLLVLNRDLPITPNEINKFNKSLGSYSNVITPLYIGNNCYDSLKYKIKFYGFNDYRVQELESQSNIVTSFIKNISTKSETTLNHFALESVKIFDPRFKTILEDNLFFPVNSVVKFHFYSSFNYGLIYPNEINNEWCFVRDKLVIIGDIHDYEYSTPMRFNSKENNSLPDMSSTLVLANAIQSLLLLTYE